MAALDTIYYIPSWPERGTKNRADRLRVVAGGCAVNAALTVSNLSGKAGLIAPIGDDWAGEWLLRQLSSAGIDTKGILQCRDTATAQSAVLIEPDGERSIVNHRAESLFDQPPQIRSSYDKIDAVLTDTRWPALANLALYFAASNNIPGILDAEAPLNQALDALISASHVVFSQQGLAEFASTTDPWAGLKYARQHTKAWVAVTRGPDPVLCLEDDHCIEVPTYRTHPYDTLGAGDVWHGAFALFLADGYNPCEAVKKANATTAIKIQHPSGEGFPNHDQLSKFEAEFSR